MAPTILTIFPQLILLSTWGAIFLEEIKKKAQPVATQLLYLLSAHNTSITINCYSNK